MKEEIEDKLTNGKDSEDDWNEYDSVHPVPNDEAPIDLTHGLAV